MIDAKEVEQMIAALREDDARMTEAPWDSRGFVFGPAGERTTGFCNGFQDGSEDKLESGMSNAAGIARLRNNARALADQLEAQQREIARLESNEADDDAHRPFEIAMYERHTKEIEQLRAEIAQLRQGLHPDGSGRYDALLVERRKRRELTAEIEQLRADAGRLDDIKSEVARLSDIERRLIDWRSSSIAVFDAHGAAKEKP